DDETHAAQEDDQHDPSEHRSSFRNRIRWNVLSIGAAPIFAQGPGRSRTPGFSRERRPLSLTAPGTGINLLHLSTPFHSRNPIWRTYGRQEKSPHEDQESQSPREKNRPQSLQGREVRPQEEGPHRPRLPTHAAEPPEAPQRDHRPGQPPGAGPARGD